MAVTQYIGARYVPVFADPIAWDNVRTYEPLTIVQNAGNSYTSKQHVPAGIDISNGEYWALTGNYNAQIEQYRAQVAAFDGRINANASAITAEAQAREEADATIENNVAALQSETQVSMLKGKTLVVFGDSFSEPEIPNSEDEYWVKQVCTAFGMQRKNFAKGGAGWYRPDNNIATQLDRARAAMNAEERALVPVVIMYAGYNDFLQSYSASQIASGMISGLEEASAMFPNAKIVCVPFNWGYGKLYLDQKATMDLCLFQVKRAIHTSRVMFVDNAAFWNMGNSGAFRNNEHPSITGYKTIAHFMISAILGGSTSCAIGNSYTSLYGQQLPGTLTHQGANYRVENGIARGEITFRSNAVIPVQTYALMTNKIPILIPSSDNYFAVKGGTGASFGNVRLLNDGRGFYLKVENEIPANTFCRANFEFQVECNDTWSAS